MTPDENSATHRPLHSFSSGNSRYKFLADGGEMGELTRAYDWEHSPLGSPQNWPQPLKTALRILLSTGHPMFIYWGPDLIQFYNDAYRRSLGPERHPSALGQRGHDCWDEIWPIIGPQIEYVMRGEGHTWHENQRVPTTRNGRKEDIYWTYSYGPIDDPSARCGVGGVLVVCSETTGQVLAEHRLTNSEARWRELFSQAPGFICTLEGPQHVFEFANTPYYNLIGRRDIIGKTVREVLPEVEGQGFVELLDEVYRTGEAHQGLATPITLSDRERGREQTVYIDFVYQPIRDAQGQVTGILANGYDVTERVRATEVLREDDRRKDEFLAMLAHELRNPLAPIRNASELLLRTTGHDPAMHAVGDLLARQVTQLTRLIDDLLDTSRITQGRITLQREPLELCETLELVIESLRDQIAHKQHDLVVNRCDCDLWINGDLTRIIQSVANVLANAIKYTDRGGRIEISISKCADSALIEIGDNGVGISQEMVPKVFDLFVQGHQTLDRSEGGLGIGLAIVQRMVAMHGGSVTAQSGGPGLGSNFKIYFPLISAPKTAPRSNTETAAAAQKVLVVDDNADAADSLAQLLSLSGHETVTVYDSRSALQQTDSFKPDVILLDIGLPDMDGYEVARRLRAGGYAGTLIAVTGYGQAGDVKKGENAGFNRYFTKPVALDDLMTALR